MDVLVLNSFNMPVNRVSWRKALGMILNDRVEVVKEYTNWLVRTASETFRVPSIVRCIRKAGGAFRKNVKFNRKNVYLRDKGRCQYCGQKVPMSEFTYDHVFPKMFGGKTKWTNIVVACLPCNQRKDSREPHQAGMSLRQEPVRPKTLPGLFSFRWNAEMPADWGDYAGTVAYWDEALES